MIIICSSLYFQVRLSETIPIIESTNEVPKQITIDQDTHDNHDKNKSLEIEKHINNKPPPPSEPAPSSNNNTTNVPLRWRPEITATKRDNLLNRMQKGRRNVMRNRASRMSETARRMLGLMSVMMAGRAQGATTGIYSKNNNDIQTGLDGNIC